MKGIKNVIKGPSPPRARSASLQERKPKLKINTMGGETTITLHFWRRHCFAVVAMLMSQMLLNICYVQANPLHSKAMNSDWNQVCLSRYKLRVHARSLFLMGVLGVVRADQGVLIAHSFTRLNVDTMLRKFHLYQITGSTQLYGPICRYNGDCFHQDGDAERFSPERFDQPRQDWTSPQSPILG